MTFDTGIHVAIRDVVVDTDVLCWGGRGGQGGRGGGGGGGSGGFGGGGTGDGGAYW